MTKLYKLTHADGRTHGGMLWGDGVTHTVKGEPMLCSETVLHAYRSPLLAVLMDPAQGCFGPEAKMWEAEGEVVIDDSTKVGCQTLTTVREIPLPVVTTEQRVHFAILAAKAAYMGSRWVKWADSWLSGKDRSSAAAADAAYARAAALGAARAADAKIDLVALAEQAISEEAER